MTTSKFMLTTLAGAALWLSATPSLAEPAQWQSGEQVYAKVCGHCHEAGIGPQIKGRSLPPAYINIIVRNGFRAMPALRASFIDDESLQAVAEYVSTSPTSADNQE